MLRVRLAKNKFESEFFLDGKRLDVEDARLEYIGKNQVLVLVVRDYHLLPESRCPERNRFERVMQAFGNAAAIGELQPTCSLIRLNPRACDGCKDRPL